MSDWLPDFTLNGKTILVTGASRGLGLAMAQAMAASGATVVLNGRDEASLKAACDMLTAAGYSADIAPFDVLDMDAAEEALAGIKQRHGGLYGLINNAGHQHRSPIEDFADDAFQEMIAVHLTSAFQLSKRAAKMMLEDTGSDSSKPLDKGRIINICSVLSSHGRPTVPAYAAAKTGLVGLIRGLAADLGPRGVNINGIAPGYFLTEINKPLLADKEFTAWVESRTPVRRWAEPRELGGAAVYLMSPAASFVNGHVLSVDGGMTAVL